MRAFTVSRSRIGGRRQAVWIDLSSIESVESLPGPAGGTRIATKSGELHKVVEGPEYVVSLIRSAPTPPVVPAEDEQP